MVQNPYAHNPSAPQYADFGGPTAPPQRTSIMAILSLVLGIVCVPGFGLLGLIFGIGAILGIKASRGRVGGGGIATAGVILSLLSCLMWIGLTVGLMQMMQGVGTQAGDLITDIRDSDVDGVREHFDPAIAPQVTPELITAFLAAADADVGKYVGTPKGVWQFFAWLSDLQKPFDHVQDKKLANNGFAFPIEFEKGKALLIIRAEEFSLGDFFKGHVQNVGLLTKDLKEIWLLPP